MFLYKYESIVNLILEEKKMGDGSIGATTGISSKDRWADYEEYRKNLAGGALGAKSKPGNNTLDISAKLSGTDKTSDSKAAQTSIMPGDKDERTKAQSVSHNPNDLGNMLANWSNMDWNKKDWTASASNA